MEELHIKAETEITFEWGKKVEASPNLAWNYGKTIKLGWQFPFCLPLLPDIKFKIGIKFQLYFKATIGFQINFKSEKDDSGDWNTDFDLNFIIDFSIGIKM